MKKRYSEERSLASCVRPTLGWRSRSSAGSTASASRATTPGRPSSAAWDVSDAQQRLKALEAENGKLKRRLGQLGARARRDARGAAPKVVAVAARREVVRQLQGLGLSERKCHQPPPQVMHDSGHHGEARVQVLERRQAFSEHYVSGDGAGTSVIARLFGKDDELRLATV